MANAFVTATPLLVPPPPPTPPMAIVDVSTTRAVRRATNVVPYSINGRGGQRRPTTPPNANRANVSATVDTADTIRLLIDSRPVSTRKIFTKAAASASIAP